MMDNFSILTDSQMVDEILRRHNIGNFDCPGGTDKQSIHCSGPLYQRLFAELQENNISPVVVEIGVQYGGSLLLWHELCPSAYVVGLDVQNIVHPSIFERMDKNRYSFIQGDGYCEEIINQLKKIAPSGIDIAIDDGPHTLESQCNFLRHYCPLLKRGGYAVLEDIQSEEWLPILQQNIPEGMLSQVVDRRHAKGRYDDLLLVIHSPKIN